MNNSTGVKVSAYTASAQRFSVSIKNASSKKKGYHLPIIGKEPQASKLIQSQ